MVIRVARRGDRVVVQVEDNGPGVAPEMADSLFEAYQTTKPRGMGLGLPLSLQIVQKHAGRLWWDGARLKLPLLGDALLKAETARFARAMGTLVGNSVPLVQSLGIAAATLNNRTISGALVGVAMGVKRGEGIATPMRKAGVFPPLAAHLLTVGEETGKLDTMFIRMADIYEEETRAAIKRFTAIFEPVVILVMGIIVGALVLSMLIAITSINDVAI